MLIQGKKQNSDWEYSEKFTSTQEPCTLRGFAKILSASSTAATNQYSFTDFDIPAASVRISYPKEVMINHSGVLAEFQKKCRQWTDPITSRGGEQTMQ